MTDVSPPTASPPITEAVLRTVLKSELAALRAEIRAEMDERFATKAEIRAEMDERFATKAEIRAEMDDRFATKADLRTEIEGLRADIAAIAANMVTRDDIREMIAGMREDHRREFGALYDVDRAIQDRAADTERSLTELHTVVDAHRQNAAIHVRPRKPRPKRRARR